MGDALTLINLQDVLSPCSRWVNQQLGKAASGASPGAAVLILLPHLLKSSAALPPGSFISLLSHDLKQKHHRKSPPPPPSVSPSRISCLKKNPNLHDGSWEAADVAQTPAAPGFHQSFISFYNSDEGGQSCFDGNLPFLQPLPEVDVRSSLATKPLPPSSRAIPWGRVSNVQHVIRHYYIMGFIPLDYQLSLLFLLCFKLFP